MYTLFLIINPVLPGKNNQKVVLVQSLYPIKQGISCYLLFKKAIFVTGK